MNRFKDLIVWQKAILLTTEVYRITKTLPAIERFGLCSQINRAVVSIPSNIAEGAGRNSNKEYCYFLSISQGSAFEVESLIVVCCKLNYFKEDELKLILNLLNEVQRMLYSLQQRKRQSMGF